TRGIANVIYVCDRVVATPVRHAFIAAPCPGKVGEPEFLQEVESCGGSLAQAPEFGHTSPGRAPLGPVGSRRLAGHAGVRPGGPSAAWRRGRDRRRDAAGGLPPA